MLSQRVAPTSAAGSRLTRIGSASRCSTTATGSTGAATAYSSVALWTWLLGLFAGCSKKCDKVGQQCASCSVNDQALCDAENPNGGTCTYRYDTDCACKKECVPNAPEGPVHNFPG